MVNTQADAWAWVRKNTARVSPETVTVQTLRSAQGTITRTTCKGFDIMSDDSKKPKIGRNTGNAGKGRPKGSLNKATTEFRETINLLLEHNKDNVALWLHQVATGEHGKEPAPEKALDLLAKLAEYAAPKLSRMEHTGDNKNPVSISFSWKK